MEKLVIIYLGRKLKINGTFQYADPHVGMYDDDFTIEQVFDDSKDITYQFDLTEFEDMEKLALIERKENSQAKWEAANV